MDAEKDIHGYLLGTLPPDRLEEIEQRILTDDDFHEEVEIAEEELLDSYAQGKLVGQERQLFEAYFLASPLRQERLKFAIAFQKKLNRDPRTVVSPFRNPIIFYRYALAASVLLAAVLGGTNYLSFKAVQKERDDVAQLKTQLEQTRQQASSISQNSILSTPELLPINRGKEQKPIVAPENVLVIRFNLVVPSGIQGKVRIDLLNDAGQTLLSQQEIQVGKTGDKNVVTVLVEKKLLKTGNYFLKVHQDPSREDYAFQVASTL